MNRSSPRTKVLLVGWDAADWKAIHPLPDAGKMPNLSRLLDGGVMGNIATLQRPFKHGIPALSVSCRDLVTHRKMSFPLSRNSCRAQAC